MSVAPKSPVSGRSFASRRSAVTLSERQKTPANSGRPARSRQSESAPSRTKRQRRLPEAPAKLTHLKENRHTFAPPARAQRETRGKMTKILPQAQSMPVWLQWLMSWQRCSSAIAFLLVGGTLVVYGSTVYTQQLWSKEYRKLETLQRQERQLTAAGEMLKNKLADQAEQPGTGFVPPTPSNTLFLEPTSQPRATSSVTPMPTPAASPTLTPTPMGY